MNVRKLTLLSSLVSVLVGCGGGSSSDSDSGQSVLLKGKAIDGYIIGATVFLDLNLNNQLDANEPNVKTQGEGDFELSIPSQYQQCAKYVPLVVDVPKGAIDTDTPDTPIEDAYQMVFPPQFALTTDQDLLNLTPLTSVVWKQVEQELRSQQSSGLSCDSILKEEALRADISQRLKEQEFRVAQRYNVTVNELYGDYVASGDTALHELAKALVPGLQKSYTETKQLVDANPEADFAWVEYFLGVWDSSTTRYNESWYRYEFVQPSNGNFHSETYLMSDDLDTKISLYDKHQMVTNQRDGVNIESTISLEPAESGYYCARSEWLETLLEESSGVRNTMYSMVGDWDSCLTARGEVTQALVTKNYQDHMLISYTEHTYHPGTVSGFEHLIGVTDTVSELDLKPVRDVINTDFYSEQAHGADYWHRTKNDFSAVASEPSQIMTSHDSDGRWERFTSYRDGTHKKECGDSEESLSVENCKN
ncbi:lipoprotein [Vibrio alfacsensis]|uniref:hypothetical protein n=1 Tax=Vibrio alfacsensis TaxID=1074311 RepID=UPI001BF08762|nr:hypothetical protein [Vibrio alfacsensis]BBM64753.1 lipoprotein [Vibrio alfacsensis]